MVGLKRKTRVVATTLRTRNITADYLVISDCSIDSISSCFQDIWPQT